MAENSGRARRPTPASARETSRMPLRVGYSHIQSRILVSDGVGPSVEPLLPLPARRHPASPPDLKQCKNVFTLSVLNPPVHMSLILILFSLFEAHICALEWRSRIEALHTRNAPRLCVLSGPNIAKNAFAFKNQRSLIFDYSQMCEMRIVPAAAPVFTKFEQHRS